MYSTLWGLQVGILQWYTLYGVIYGTWPHLSRPAPSPSLIPGPPLPLRTKGLRHDMNIALKSMHANGLKFLRCAFEIRMPRAIASPSAHHPPLEL